MLSGKDIQLTLLNEMLMRNAYQVDTLCRAVHREPLGIINQSILLRLDINVVTLPVGSSWKSPDPRSSAALSSYCRQHSQLSHYTLHSTEDHSGSIWSQTPGPRDPGEAHARAGKTCKGPQSV
jgi:hypothetical protein